MSNESDVVVPFDTMVSVIEHITAGNARIKELETQLDNYQRTLGDAIEREDNLKAENRRLREDIALLDEDLRCYQADL